MRILKKITLLLALPIICLLIAAPAFADAPIQGPPVSSSAKSAIQCGVNSAASGDCNTQPTGDLNTTIRSVVNLLSVLVGVAAVIMIMVGGLRYITSAGNAEGAKSARSTITYALIGLVVVALAQIIVHFVITSVK
jgi:cytochrome bd-type quinol oxidase subunit 2